MSGIVAILQPEGTSVDAGALWRMTRSMARHGPDAQHVWASGGVGLGHAMLRTTPESCNERQPASLDAAVWIAADCRLDGRDDLRRDLLACGRSPRPDASDVDLLLHAYAAWQERCVERLHGDFAFALWDAPRRRLLCARDHFGVKPLYYAQTAGTFLCSNRLNTLRLHPGVPATLDDEAIAHFLVFGLSLDRYRSAFAAIRRVPPAHRLLVCGGRLTLQRYWDPAEEGEIRYPRRRDYIDRFRELLDLAIRDRLRTSKASILLSGGLDSPAIAAAVQGRLSGSRPHAELYAHTIVFDRIAPDEERRYSQLVADTLRIPIRHHPFDDYGFPPPEREPEGYPPEPRELLDWGRAIAVHRLPAGDARVVLRGDGADPLLLATAAAPQELLTHGRYFALIKEYVWLIWSRRQVPYFGVRTMLRGALRGADRVGAVDESPSMAWLRPEVARALGLRDRWRAEAIRHPTRSASELSHPYWPAFFDWIDPAGMDLAAETRYPFFDRRLAGWLLRVPDVPWAMEKSLLRLALKGILPDEIVRRRKAPLAGHPWAALLPPARTAWWRPYLSAASELAEFVDVQAADATLTRVLPQIEARRDRADIDLLRSCLRPVSLSLWLQRVAHGRFSQSAPSSEVTDG